MPYIAAGASLLGGLLGGRSSRKAAQARAASEREAARLAAEEARFRPVGVTTRFGSSNFQFDPTTGRVSGVNYSLDPALTGMQNRFLGLAEGGLFQAEQAQDQYAPLGQATQGLFNLGQQYIAESPEQAAEKYILGRQNLLAPSRERQLAGIRTNQFNTGRTGLSVGGTGLRPGGGEGLRASNPEMEAYYNAIAQEDARLAAEGMQAGQAQTLFGADLFRTGGNLGNQMYGLQASALSPYEAYLQQARQLESLGQQSFEMGSNLGRNIANTTGADAMYRGGMGAAESMYKANSYNPTANFLLSASQNPALMRGARNAISPSYNYGAFGGGSGTFGEGAY
jgi:hypothetical protein